MRWWIITVLTPRKSNSIAMMDGLVLYLMIQFCWLQRNTCTVPYYIMRPWNFYLATVKWTKNYYVSNQSNMQLVTYLGLDMRDKYTGWRLCVYVCVCVSWGQRWQQQRLQIADIKKYIIYNLLAVFFPFCFTSSRNNWTW